MEYYGDMPYSEELYHYGVKGMRWGVRRARESRNERALDRHYNRAVKKLGLLTRRSDRELVGIAKKRNVKETLGNSALGGLASGLGTYAINSHLPVDHRLKYAAAIGGAMAGANAIAGGINQVALSRMHSKEGNAKQNAKRKEFEKEMRKAFRGTRYAKKIDRSKAEINSQIKQAKKILDPNRQYRRYS